MVFSSPKMADLMDLDPPRGTKRKAEDESDQTNTTRRIKVCDATTSAADHETLTL